MKKVQLVMVFLLIAATNTFGQNKSDQLINSLVGEWVSVNSVNHTIIIKRDENFLSVTETTIEDDGKSYITASKIYLDGRLQKDAVKQSANAAQTVVNESNLTTTYYGLKNGDLKESFKERLSIKNGKLILAAQIKIGIPFLSAGAKQVFQQSTNK